MDISVKKYFKVGGIIIGSVALISILWYEIRLYLIYDNVSTIDEAIADMQSPNMIFIELNNSSISDVAVAGGSDTGQYQYSNDGSDNIDAVQFNGNVYTGDASTGTYYGVDGSTYNSNSDILTLSDGSIVSIDPDTVTYGTLESDGNFIND